MERALRSMTGVVRRLDSRETSLRSEQRFSSTASHRKLAAWLCIGFVAHNIQTAALERLDLPCKYLAGHELESTKFAICWDLQVGLSVQVLAGMLMI